MPTSHSINRQSLRQQRLRLSALHRQLAAVRIAVTVQAHIPTNCTIASYASTTHEVSTNYLQRLLIRRGITVLLPVVRAGNTLALVRCNKGQQYKNTYGINEPRYTPARQHPLNTINTILVPLLGFDQQCHRIGMGGGYYDRLLVRQHSAKIFGLAFKQQRLRRIRPQPWDQPMQCVITPRRQFVRLRQK